MDPLADLRRNAYKARSHFKPEEVRRRRETVQVELRKQKKEESLAKRRNFTTQSLPADSDDEIETEVSDSQVKPEIIGYQLDSPLKTFPCFSFRSCCRFLHKT